MPTNERPIPRAATSPPLAGQGAIVRRWHDGALFLRGFLRQPGQVGSLVPSSARLERRIVREARADQATMVVELGPGTGGTTAALLATLRPGSRLLALELDPVFHRHLTGKLRDPRLGLELASAEQLAQCLDRHGLPAPDAIVSGIPFSTLSPETARRIAAIIAGALAPGGRFVAYQVRAQVARYLTPHLGPPRVAWELVNVPPVRVFTWERTWSVS